jgi:integrase
MRPPGFRRKGEITSLRWSQVDMDAGTVRPEPGTTKNDEGREIPFRALPELATLVEAQRAHTDAVEQAQQKVFTHVFHRNGERIGCFRGAWDAACKRAGQRGAWFHDLRRTAVRRLEMAGVSRSVAMRITGHKTESVFRRYAIADRRAIEEGMEKIHRFRQEQAEKRTVVPMRREA